ncbi:MAG TPA: alpha/beta hydrolase [Flavitalea sp.]|nr:alpha/beta hydrolase [Flavitalea sp.]
MKYFLAVIMLFNASMTRSQQVISLYQGKAPGSENWKQVEKENNNNAWQTRIVYNVANPTITVFKPSAEVANGTAIVICPGGGFHALSIDSEGFDVAKWLAAKGVTCFVLKYRLVEIKTQDPVGELSAKGASINTDVEPVVKLATADALKAIDYVRSNAKQFNIDPKKIGIIGFSAGGTVTASAAFHYTEASRPDFVAAIYLQYDWVTDKKVPASAPPLFILAASNDQLGLAPHSIRLYNDWTAAKKPVELIMYEVGGHGFGMKKQNLPSDKWIERFGDWLEGKGLLKK